MYVKDPHNAILISRKIFQERGYVLVFSDVMDQNNKFEDWYVYPDFINMDNINTIKTTK